MGHPHWVVLMKAWDKGWRPAPHELVDINEAGATESTERGVGFVKTTEGVIAGNPRRHPAAHSLTALRLDLRNSKLSPK